MPAESATIDQEGILIRGQMLVRNQVFLDTEMSHLLSSGPWPARNPSQNLADSRAQLAANAKGVTELQRLLHHFGKETVSAYMQHVQDNAEACVRRVIETLNDGTFTLEMDDGALIKASITVNRTARTAKIDFSGTSPQRPGNKKCPVGGRQSGCSLCLPHARR